MVSQRSLKNLKLNGVDLAEIKYNKYLQYV